MLHAAAFQDVSLSYMKSSCYPGCNPDSNCFPCDPCGPSTVCNPQQSSDEEMGCRPCSPCYPDEECYPCLPCNPDSRCRPCSPCYPDMVEEDDDESSGSSSGCFITSACVETLGLSDNCEELQILRVLRDKRRLYDSAFDTLVKEYYLIAPKIVSAIDALPERKIVYKNIYETMVRPCVNLVKLNCENEAIEKYIDTVMNLKEVYLKAI